MTSTVQSITLASYPFKDQCNIIKVFSKQKGVITLLVKGISSKNTEKISLCSPLTLSEITYRKGKQDLHTLLETNLIDLHLQVRKNLQSIQSCLTMCKTLLQTQQAEKPSPILFDLFSKYIKKICEESCPKHYELSFKLKTLLHDGKIHFGPSCSHCKKKPTSIYKGESFCSIHSPNYSTSFTDLEFETLRALTYSRTYLGIQMSILSETFEKKVHELYLSMLD